ncbi:MAG: PKD domain-containing protein, partial [Thermoplasmatales archaeon]|nr:PKD domain-containing protein [Thermoplasmatales archaeon]
PEGDQILYLFDWGDNTTSEWLGPYDSGATVNAVHAWNDVGDYEIKVKAKDINGSASGWSDPLSITIIQAPLLDIFIIRGGFFKVNTVINNVGAVEATNVNWEITLEGGTIFRGRTTTGTITSIPPQDGVQIFSDLILGLGEVRVKVTAEIPESVDSRDQGGKVFLFFIKVTPGGI